MSKLSKPNLRTRLASARPRFDRLSLRTKIIAWSFVPTAIILAAVALTGFVAYQSVTEALTSESSREVAQLSAGEIDSALAEYANSLTSVARTPFLYSVNLDVRRAALSHAANRLAVFDGGVVMLDIHGQVIATEPERPDIMGQNWSDRSYYRQMVRSPGAIWSQVIDDGPGGTPVIVLAVPLTDEVGDLLGTLAAMFRVSGTSISPFYGSIVRLRIGGNGAAYIADDSGRVIFHSDANLIGSDFSSQVAVRQALAGTSGVVRTTDTAGNEILASFSPVPATPWVLVTEQNWDALLEPGRRYGQFLLLLLALGLVLPAFVVTIGVRRITEPINQLITATLQVASGRLGQQISIETHDELEELGCHFNQMSAQLAESYQKLKAREERFALVMQGTN
ncbi:MAG: HAMP domain-containing protein, partial [Chloroflexi bacterium]|nr:HAMP domain-containing protein [Chloroflexota bacterium]